MFAGKVKCLQGRPLAIPANIKLGWKGLPGKNTLAYHKNLYNTSVKSFIGLTPVEGV
jgi:hypothetical protein